MGRKVGKMIAWTRLLAIEIESSEWMEIHLGGKVNQTWVFCQQRGYWE